MSQQASLLARFPALSKINSWPKPIQIGVGAVAIALIAMLLLWSRAPEFRVLFSSLEDRDGGAIVTALNQMNVPYKFSENGSAILVPADRVYESRLKLAEQGLPRGGKVGFELLDQTRFGASQFTEQITYQRALEGELSSSIQAVQSVQQARVHLAIPRESLFVRERQTPTASVLLTLYAGRSLNPAQVSAIAWLVSASVPNLSSENVSVIDQNGRLLTSPTGAASADTARRDFANDIEQRTVQRILALITPLAGAGNVRAQATADIDFTQREQTSEVYRPNQRAGEAAIRSEQTSNSAQNSLLFAEGVPGALSNQAPINAIAPITTTPSAAPATAATGPAFLNPAPAANTASTSGTGRNDSDRGNRRQDATINYEVDRTISHIKEPTGALRRLSVAVVVNYKQINNGKPEPLAATDLDNLRNLVKEAMGYSQIRGDTLSIVNSSFSNELPASIPIWENPAYQALALQIGQYLLIALVILLVWRSVLRPILLGIINPAEGRINDGKPATAIRDDETEATKRASEISRYEDNLNTARGMAEKDPRAIAMVIRSWMEKHGGN